MIKDTMTTVFKKLSFKTKLYSVIFLKWSRPLEIDMPEENLVGTVAMETRWACIPILWVTQSTYDALNSWDASYIWYKFQSVCQPFVWIAFQMTVPPFTLVLMHDSAIGQCLRLSSSDLTGSLGWSGRKGGEGRRGGVRREILDDLSTSGGKKWTRSLHNTLNSGWRDETQ